MSTRITELAEQIWRLTRQRDAQPADTLYALTYQKRIDRLSVELVAWTLDHSRMHAAEHAVRAAARRRHRAHTGRRRWPATAGVSGVLGTLATAGQLAADASHPPLIGGTLLAVAAAALALTAFDRVRDAREAAAAEADMNTAQRQYTAIVRRHAHAITPVTVAIHDKETSCASPQHPQSPATSTTPVSGPAPAVTSGRPPAASAASATSSAAAA